MADIIEFNPEERAARRNPDPPTTKAEAQAHILRDAMINIVSGARDLKHACQIASEALDDIEEDDGGKAPA